MNLVDTGNINLINAYLDVKIGFDTAENEPSKVRWFPIGVGGFILYAATIMQVSELAGPFLINDSAFRLPRWKLWSADGTAFSSE